MKLLTIFIFLLCIYGFGRAITFFMKKNDFETVIIRLGVGLGSIPLVGILLNALNIPLDWRIFLGIALIFPLYDLFTHRKQLKLPRKINKPSAHTIFLCIIFIFCFYIYCAGPFVYPWLEDDDSWSHATSIKYISIEKNINVLPGEFHYLNPYPPGYGVVFAFLHQINPSLYWTLKFFNGFIIALGYLFFYCFVRDFSSNKEKAFLSTLFLVMIPCYLNHFIWAHSLVITLFFPALHTLIKSRKDKRFLLASCIVMTGILFTQPTQAIKFIIFVLIMIFSFSIIEKKVWKSALLCLLAAGVVSLLWWGPIIKTHLSKSSDMNILLREGKKFSGEIQSIDKLNIFGPGSGSVTRAYTFTDYFVSHVGKKTHINSPVGVGFIICLIALYGLSLSFIHLKKGTQKNKIYSLTLLLWFIFTFLGTNSMTFNLPVGLFGFRFWILFAIPTCILAAQGYHDFDNRIDSLNSRIIAFCVLLVVTYATSGYYKYKINMSAWPWGIYWTSEEEVYGYAYFQRKIEPNTKVFTFTDNQFVIGFDMRADFWKEDYKKTFSDAITLTAEGLHKTLKKHGYSYVIVSERDVKKFGQEKMDKKVEELHKSGLFEADIFRGMVWSFKAL